jgi:hypothetical protein
MTIERMMENRHQVFIYLCDIDTLLADLFPFMYDEDIEQMEEIWREWSNMDDYMLNQHH